jgi:beta-N-acetylhexosaminidase
MEMGALQSNYKNADLAVLAVKAGNDILMYVSTFLKQQEAYDAILAAVQSGEISEERIDESLKRILNLKKEIIK